MTVHYVIYAHIIKVFKYLFFIIFYKSIQLLFYFFLWWPGFEPRTLHILCIVLAN
jgi:hypothetical protein